MRKNVETKRVKRSPIMGKRIAAGVLAGLMVIGSLMGCGSGDSDNTNNYSVMQKVCPMEFRSIYLPIHDMVPGIDTAEYAKKVYELGCEKYGKDTMEEILSLSAYKILLNMFRLNLFEHPYVDIEESLKIVGCSEHMKAGYEVQLKSVVMLKNKNN